MPAVIYIDVIGSDERLLHEQVLNGAEIMSEHPQGQTIVRYLSERGVDPLNPDKFRCITGKGIEFVKDGNTYLSGNVMLMNDAGVEIPGRFRDEALSFENEGKTPVFVSVNNRPSRRPILGSLWGQEPA